MPGSSSWMPYAPQGVKGFDDDDDGDDYILNIGHNEFAVNILEGAIVGKKAVGRPRNRRQSRIGHTIGHNEFVVNILERAIFGKRAVGRPGLQCLKQAARNTEADSYTAMERMACNISRWKAANRSKD